jgi:DNA mismatch endonuclease (patch repair protein)
MAAVRATHTGPELVLRKALHTLGYRFRLHDISLPGKPDLVFREKRVVILVHGCFWHRHNCKSGRSLPAVRTEFWSGKLKSNVERDRRNARRLRRLDWTVVVVWECQLKTKTLEKSVARILRILDER